MPAKDTHQQKVSKTKKIKVGGAGDTIEKVLKKTGVKKVVEIFVNGKDCGCEKRKEWLNDKLPNRMKVKCFTEKQYQQWQLFKLNRTIQLNEKQTKYVCDLYAEIFMKPVWYPGHNESIKPLILMIDRLDIVYESYN